VSTTAETAPLRFASFDEFWPYYVREHSKAANRALHFAGTTAAMALVAGAVATRSPLLLVAAPIVGYGASWIGHFAIERRPPAAFKHPWWSFLGDMKMWSLIATRRMAREVERATA
jgi:hypothetical protein